MKILITGVAGFIGSNMAEYFLDNGISVVGIDNLSDYYSKDLKERNLHVLLSKGLEFHEQDLLDIHDISLNPGDISHIVHFAAQPGISQTTSFEDYRTNNLDATKALIDFAVNCNNLKLFVNISTSSVYGAFVSKDENAVPQPVSWYGITKLAAEQMVMAKDFSDEFPACSLRLYSVYGPRERPEKLYTKLIDSIVNGRDFSLYEGSLDHLRSYTYVGDIVEGIASVIGKESKVRGEIINIGSDHQRSTREGIEIVESILAKKAHIKTLPPRLGDQVSTRAIIDKAKCLLGYHPRTTLEDGLKKQVKWFEAAESESSGTSLIQNNHH